MLPVLKKNLLYVPLYGLRKGYNGVVTFDSDWYHCMVWEKAINGVVYFWQWLLYTHVIGVVESPTTVYMRDDWEKLSDEKSSTCAMIGTS